MTKTETAIRGFSGNYQFLSNFYVGEPLHYQFIFPTAEHMFNALKTEDPSEALWVSNAPTPSEAKRRGR
ncbi:MAG TPA: hypothetical protein VNA32_07560, partial [Actinomycetota bacterium]|nr:hypothetical protein [Actinomycetota bacterium]